MPRPDRLADRAVFQLHHRAIHLPRVERIAQGLARLAPGGAGGAMLDVGCGNGILGKRVAELIEADTVRGVDVLVRADTCIPVVAYDGEALPYPDASFDVVSICDVLHHAENPLAVMRSALRVLRPGGRIVVKDHLRFGVVSNAVLLAMDMLGNYSTAVHVRGTYLSRPEWFDLVARAGGRVDAIVWPFDVHTLPWSLLARNEYQFLMRVVPR